MYLFICIDESLFNLDVVSCNRDLRKLIVWRRGSREAEGSEAPTEVAHGPGALTNRHVSLCKYATDSRGINVAPFLPASCVPFVLQHHPTCGMSSPNDASGTHKGVDCPQADLSPILPTSIRAARYQRSFSSPVNALTKPSNSRAGSKKGKFRAEARSFLERGCV